MPYMDQKQINWAVATTRDLLRAWNLQDGAMKRAVEKLNHTLSLLPIGPYADVFPYYQLREAINMAIRELSL